MGIMARSITVRLLVLGLGVFFVGCGAAGLPAGTYAGKREYTAKPGDDMAVLGTMSRVKLTIRANGAFLLVDGGVPMEGHVRSSGDQTILGVETLIGRPIPDGDNRDVPVRRKGEKLELTFTEGKVVLSPQAEPG